MNKRNLSILIAAITASVLVCCSKQSETDPKIPENGDGQYQSLELTSVRESEFQSKAVLDGEAFPQDGHIGLFLFADAAASQTYGEGYENVDYSYNSQKGKWTASPSIKVGSTPGHLYGYYPYKAANTDIKAIPVVSSFNGDDMMYATPQDPITDQTAGNVSVTMKHALARVSVIVTNKGYTGDAKLQSIKFAGAEIAESGTLNAVDGTITATKAQAVTLTVPEASQAIATGSGSVYECLLVPSEVVAGRQNVKVTLKIDGQEKSANLTGDNGVIFGSGVKSRIVINLSNSGISVPSVSIDDWQTVEVGEHKVTVKLENDVPAGDITLNVYPDNQDVRITAISRTGKKLYCSRDDIGVVAPSFSNNFFDFIISDITTDVVATVGYAKHTLTLTAALDTMGTFKMNADIASQLTVLYGSDVTIRAVPYANHRFVKWTDNGSDSNPRIITVTSDSTITADFIRQWKISADLASGSEGAGTFKFDNTAATEKMIDNGGSVTIQAFANIGYEFVKWTGSNGEDLGTDNPIAISNVDSDKTIRAVFREKNVTLKLASNNDPNASFKMNGKVAGQLTVPIGSDVTIRAVPSADYRFVKWTDNGSDSNPRIVTVTSDSTITADFIRQWKISADLASGSEGMGTIKINYVATTERKVDNGGSVIIQAVANNGFVFLKWIDAGGNFYSTNNPIIISNVESDKSIKAVFASIEGSGTEFENDDNW